MLVFFDNVMKFLFVLLSNRRACIQCGDTDNVGDLARQPFYQFLQKTYIAHPIALVVLLYTAGGFPFLVWGMVREM